MSLTDHVDHEWRKFGHCVYCECGERLYQGNTPKTTEEKRALAELWDAVVARMREERAK